MDRDKLTPVLFDFQIAGSGSIRTRSRSRTAQVFSSIHTMSLLRTKVFVKIALHSICAKLSRYKPVLVECSVSINWQLFRLTKKVKVTVTMYGKAQETIIDVRFLMSEHGRMLGFSLRRSFTSLEHQQMMIRVF